MGMNHAMRTPRCACPRARTALQLAATEDEGTAGTAHDRHHPHREQTTGTAPRRAPQLGRRAPRARLTITNPNQREQVRQDGSGATSRSHKLPDRNLRLRLLREVSSARNRFEFFCSAARHSETVIVIRNVRR
jgi:hypothetical protein